MNRITKSIAGLMLAATAFSFSSCDDEADVIGLDDATKYGYIKVTLVGRDPNGDDFEVTKNYKFSPSGGPEGSSSVYTYSDDGFYREFDLERYLGPFENGNNYVDLEFTMYGQSEPSVDNTYFYFETDVTTDDNEFFSLGEYVNFSDEDITSYQYNENTGKLSFKFTRELDGSSTGYPLTVTVNASVKVFEDINGDFEE